MIEYEPLDGGVDMFAFEHLSVSVFGWIKT